MNEFKVDPVIMKNAVSQKYYSLALLYATDSPQEGLRYPLLGTQRMGADPDRLDLVNSEVRTLENSVNSLSC